MSYRLHDVLALVPLNDEGKIVLQQAKYLQDVLGVRIYVLHVIPPVSPFLRLFKPRQIRAKEHEAVKKLTQFVKDFFGGEIPNSVIIDVLQGPLAPTIIRHVDKENFLFIILKPSPGETGAESTPDQKAADEIIRQVNCPVLTINQEATKHGIRNILNSDRYLGRDKKKVALG
jgi:nucleotide-binding universal stress UspA family protein